MTDTVPSNPSATDESQEMTAEEIRDAFRRYDIIIAAGVLLTAFFAASFRCTAPDLFGRIRAGELIAQRFPTLPSVDDFTFTASTRALAVNPSWLFDLSAYQLYRVGDVALTGAKIAVVVLTVGVLFLIRYRGPTLAWQSLCILLAVVAMSGSLDVDPMVAGCLLLSLLLLTWHRATTRGPSWLLYLTIPIAIAWANVDISFVLAPVVLTALCVGELLPRKRAAGDWIEIPRPSRMQVVLVLVGTWLAGIASPYLFSNVRYSWTWIFRTAPQLPRLDVQGSGWGGAMVYLRTNDRGVVGFDWEGFGRHLLDVSMTWPVLAWLSLVVLAVAATVANWRTSQPSRRLLLPVAIALPFVAERWLGASGILLGYVACLCGQEYFLRRFGTDVRTGFGSILGSQLSRIGLILLLFAGLLGTLTGRVQGRPAQIGYTIARDKYIETGAKKLTALQLSGEAFAIGPAQRVSSYLEWDGPKRRTFSDIRWISKDSGWIDYEKARVSLLGFGGRTIDPNEWKKIFQRWGVTHVVVDALEEPEMFRVRHALSLRPELAPLHADDQCIVYGWLSPESPDYARIRKARIRTNVLAFREKRDPPTPTEQPVTAPRSVYDRLWPWRFVDVPPGLIEGTFYSLGGTWLSEPGTSILATARLRNAVSAAPNSPSAHLRLGLAYMNLIKAELERMYAAQAVRRSESSSAELTKPLSDPSKKPLDSPGGEGETAKLLASIRDPGPRALEPAMTTLTRHHQAAAAIQNALTAGEDSLGAHQAMASLCLMNGFLDLALEHTKAMSRKAEAPMQREALDRDVAFLEQEVARYTALYRDSVASRSQQLRSEADRLETQAAEMEKQAEKEVGLKQRQMQFMAQRTRQQAEQCRVASSSDLPMDNSKRAFDNHLLGLAIEEMNKVSPVGGATADVAEMAARRYLLAGRPERALEWLGVLRDSGPSPPGNYEWLLAQYHVTNGNFKEAASSIESAIAALRQHRLRSSLARMDHRIRTGLLAEDRTSNVIDEKWQTIQSEELEASFYYDLAMVHMEMGKADRAVEDFKRVLELAPSFNLSPVIDYYHQAIAGGTSRGLPRGKVWTAEDDIVRRFDPAPESAAAEASQPPAPNPLPKEDPAIPPK